ncbi:hypothetical protein ACFL1Y_02045 [Patescibacteria group bacterium]
MKSIKKHQDTVLLIIAGIFYCLSEIFSEHSLIFLILSVVVSGGCVLLPKIIRQQLMLGKAKREFKEKTGIQLWVSFLFYFD